MNLGSIANQIGIVIEAIGALYLVINARRGKRDADALGLSGSQVTYDTLGPLLDTLLKHLRSNYRHQVIAFALLFVGLALQFYGAFGSPYQSSASRGPWQGLAVNKRTGGYELWWVWHNSHDDCVRDMQYDVRSSAQSEWYREPVGCAYVGSDNRFVLYLMNRLYVGEAFQCVARLKSPAEGQEYAVILKPAPKETAAYRCVIPE